MLKYLTKNGEVVVAAKFLMYVEAYSDKEAVRKAFRKTAGKTGARIIDKSICFMVKTDLKDVIIVRVISNLHAKEVKRIDEKKAVYMIMARITTVRTKRSAVAKSTADEKPQPQPGYRVLKSYGLIKTGNNGDLTLEYVEGSYGRMYHLRYSRHKNRGVAFSYNELMALKEVLVKDLQEHLNIDDKGSDYYDYGDSPRGYGISAVRLRRVGILYSCGKYTKEVNVISWNNGVGCYDIRKLTDGSPFKGGGVTLTREEALLLVSLIVKAV